MPTYNWTNTTSSFPSSSSSTSSSVKSGFIEDEYEKRRKYGSVLSSHQMTTTTTNPFNNHHNDEYVTSSSSSSSFIPSRRKEVPTNNLRIVTDEEASYYSNSNDGSNGSSMFQRFHNDKASSSISLGNNRSCTSLSLSSSSHHSKDGGGTAYENRIGSGIDPTAAAAAATASSASPPMSALFQAVKIQPSTTAASASVQPFSSTPSFWNNNAHRHYNYSNMCAQDYSILPVVTTRTSSGSSSMGLSPYYRDYHHRQPQEQDYSQRYTKRIITSSTNSIPYTNNNVILNNYYCPQQQHQQHNHNSTTTPPSLANKNTPNNNDILYMGTTLKRQNPSQQKWGLSITTFQQQEYLIVGSANLNLVQEYTSWSLFSSTLPPIATTPLTTYASKKDNKNKEYESILKNAFLHHNTLNTPIPCTTSNKDQKERDEENKYLYLPHLQPGDIILSINGTSISTFTNLNDIINYVMSMNVLALVVMRHVDSLRASHLVMKENEGQRDDGLLAGLVAEASFMAIHKVLEEKKDYRQAKVPTETMEKSQKSTATNGQYKNDPSSSSSSSPSNSTHAAQYNKMYVSNILCQYQRQQQQQRRLYNTTYPTKVAATLSSIQNYYNTTLSSKMTIKQQQQQQKANRSINNSFNPISFQVHYITSDRRILENKLFYSCGCRTDLVEEEKEKNGKKRRYNHCNNSTGDRSSFLLYSDNEEYDPDDGTRAAQFLNPFIQNSFHQWLSKRKSSWRKKWNISHAVSSHHYDLPYFSDNDYYDNYGRRTTTVKYDFWRSQGFPSFQHWLAASKMKWKRSYSWHRDKRRKLEGQLERESEEEVRYILHYPPHSIPADDANKQIGAWLRVRKKQWRILRRKRKRRREEEDAETAAAVSSGCTEESVRMDVDNLSSPVKAASNFKGINVDTVPNINGQRRSSPKSVALFRQATTRTSSDEVDLYIDEILEDQERRERELEERPPLDISFVFDARLGAPDDVIAVCFSFLHKSEHGKMLCVNWSLRYAIRQREEMWRSLCPKHWILPRRPRKPWHAIYITKIREEEEAARKRSDEVLTKASKIICKGDHLFKIEKLVNKAIKDFGFDVNHISGVVMERNSLLNLSVIAKRHKVAKWLVESHSADIESFDRGQFTPLMNAAWAGDKYLVRYLLGKGANRSKIGTGHYTQALAPPDFEGLNAEGWARKRGHNEVADLIKLGLN